MPSTQSLSPIKDIREGIIILKNGGLRTIIAVSSLNFALKAKDEQDAIIYQFQNFLNSLDFACQIVCQSRKLNITGYLDKIKEISEKEDNELLKIQIKEYHNFIKKIMEGGDIMQKNFFVITPFSSSKIKPKESEIEEEFQRNKIQLLQRTEFVMLGLRACSLPSTPLNSLEITELLWSLHHISEAELGYFPEIPTELIK